MHYHPDRNLNTKALLYTSLICMGIYLALYFFQWTLPMIPKPILEEGIEVNLGSDETGLGQLPNQNNATIPSSEINHPTNAQLKNETATSVDPMTSDEEDAPAMVKTARAQASKLNKAAALKPKPTALPPEPKAVFNPNRTKASKGQNNADSYQPNQQGITHGNGDQGKPGGNPNADSYQGNHPSGKQGKAISSGVSIRNGLDGRRITQLPKFEDDFNENAKVAVDIVVDSSGKVISANINPRGTTTSNATIRNIAIQKAKSIQLSSSNQTESGTLVFNFKLQE